VQFVEDASPISHPIQPVTYEEISNFYTATVYEKGAEVIRMMATIVGAEGFKRGLTLYFDRHVGQAVTCEDFVRAISDANPAHDLAQFQRTWYRQRSTPRLDVSYAYDAARHELALTVRQRCGWMPPDWEPFDIPLAVGLIGRASRKPLLVRAAPGALGVATAVLRVTRAEQCFVLHGVSESPVPSLLRDFSAPVRLHCDDLSLEDLSFLAAFDTDEFVRYDSLQALALRVLCADVGGAAASVAPAVANSGAQLLLQSLRETLEASERLDKAVVAMSLELPDEHALVDAAGEGEADVDAIKAACARLTSQVTVGLGPLLLKVYEANSAPREGESNGAASARRALKNACLRAMVDGSAPARCAPARQLALRQVLAAENMTDRLGAALALRDCACPERELALQHFYETHQHDPLALNKWFALQSMSSVPTAMHEIEAVLVKGANVKFEITNPNNCYSLIKNAASNYSLIHAPGGAKFVADQIIRLDKINAQVASRIAKEMTGWRKFKAPWGGAIKAQLERIAAQPGLSPDVAEIVSKALAPAVSTL
jgi:aminopeptidase N